MSYGNVPFFFFLVGQVCIIFIFLFTVHKRCCSFVSIHLLQNTSISRAPPFPSCKLFFFLFFLLIVHLELLMCLIPKKERRCTPRFRIILSIVCLWSVHLLQCNLSFPLHSCICRYFTYAKKFFFISAFQDKLMGIVFKAHAVQQSFFP